LGPNGGKGPAKGGKKEKTPLEKKGRGAPRVFLTHFCGGGDKGVHLGGGKKRAGNSRADISRGKKHYPGGPLAGSAKKKRICIRKKTRGGPI